MRQTDIVTAVRIVGDLCDELERMPEHRTPDGQIDHERTDALIGATVHLRNAELVLMELSTGVLSLPQTAPETTSADRGRGG